MTIVLLLLIPALVVPWPAGSKSDEDVDLSIQVKQWSKPFLPRWNAMTAAANSMGEVLALPPPGDEPRLRLLCQATSDASDRVRVAGPPPDAALAADVDAALAGIAVFAQSCAGSGYRGAVSADAELQGAKAAQLRVQARFDEITR